MRYASARFKEKQRVDSYRIYVSDALKCIAENTMRFGGGSSMSKRFADVVYRKPQDTRTGDEIAADIIKKAGLIYGNGGELK